MALDFFKNFGDNLKKAQESKQQKQQEKVNKRDQVLTNFAQNVKEGATNIVKSLNDNTNPDVNKTNNVERLNKVNEQIATETNKGKLNNLNTAKNRLEAKINQDKESASKTGSEIYNTKDLERQNTNLENAKSDLTRENFSPMYTGETYEDRIKSIQKGIDRNNEKLALAKEKDDITNSFEGLINSDGKMLSNDETAEYLNNVAQVNAIIDAQNKLEEDYKNGLVDSATYGTSTMINTNKYKELEAKLSGVEYKKGYDLYEAIKDSDSEYALNMTNTLAHYDDNIVQRLGNQLGATLTDFSNIGNQALAISYTALTGEKDSNFSERANQINEQSNELKAYALSGATKMQQMEVQVLGSLMPQMVATTIAIGTGNIASIAGVALNTSTATTAILGMQTGVSDAYEMIQKGYEPDEAILHGAMYGAISYLVEKIGADGFVKMFTGEFGQELTGDFLKNKSINYINAIKKLGKQMTSEALEEVIEGISDDVANGLFNVITNSNESSELFGYDGEKFTVNTLSNAWKQLMQEGAYAGLGALIMGTGTFARVDLQTRADYKFAERMANKAIESINKGVAVEELVPVLNALTSSMENFKAKSVLSNSIVQLTPDAEVDSSVEEVLNTQASATRYDIQKATQQQLVTQIKEQGLRNALQMRGLKTNGNVEIEQVYLEANEQQRQDMLKASKFVEVLGDMGIDVEFSNGLHDTRLEGASGYNEGNKIVINANTNKSLSKYDAQTNILIHEITHVLENTSQYANVVNLINEMAGIKNVDGKLTIDENSKYKEFFDRKTALYNKNGIEFDSSEFVANFIEENIANSEFIKSAIKYNQAFAYRILSDIGMMSETDDKAKLLNAWSKAFQEIEFENKQSEIKHAIEIEKPISNENILLPYSDKEIEITHRNGDFVLNVDYNIEDFYNDTKNNNGNVQLWLGKIPDNLANRILADTGINLTGKSLVLDNDHLIHEHNEHFEDNYKNKGNPLPITIDDLNNLANIISNYDRIEPDYENNEIRFIIETDTNAEHYYRVIELVPKRNKNSVLVSMYTIKKGTLQVATANNAETSTSSNNGNGLNYALTNNISNEDNNVKMSLDEQSSFFNAQLEIIKKYNPVDESINKNATWIRSVEDIKTYEQAVNDDGTIDTGITPDFTADDIKQALETGKITVYSTYPIGQGTFVTPSKMEAESYGVNRPEGVYSKEVNLTDVAWIDGFEGQYANVEEENDSIRYSLEEDYNKAIESNDLKTASNIVKEYARTKGYSDEQYYHASNNDSIKVFDKNKIRAGETDADYNGFWVSTDSGTLPAWVKSNRTYKLFIKYGNIADSKVVNKIQKQVNTEHKKGDYSNWNENSRSVPDEVRNRLEKMGYDSIIHNDKVNYDVEELEKNNKTEFEDARGKKWLIEKNGENDYSVSYWSNHEGDWVFYDDFYNHEDINEYLFDEKIVVLFNSNQLKSSDAITYDDNGNVIPLSERFNDSNEDIRYALEEATDELHKKNVEKYGVQDKGENAVRDVEIAKATAKGKTARAVKHVAESKAVSDKFANEMQKESDTGSFTYQQTTLKKMQDKQTKNIAEVGFEKFTKKWMNDMTVKRAQEVVVQGELLLQQALQRGETELAMQIAQKLVIDESLAGQAVVASRIFSRLSPELQFITIEKQIKSIQDALDKEYKGKAPKITVNQELINELKNATTDEQKQELFQKIGEDIASQMPSKFVDKVNAWRYLAMLGNPRTHIRNIIGNTTFGVVATAKNVVANEIEKAYDKYAKSKGKEFIRKAGVINLADKADRELYNHALRDYNGHKITENKFNLNEIIADKKNVFNDNNVIGHGLNWLVKKNAGALSMEDSWAMKVHYARALSGYLKVNGLNFETATELQKKEARDYATNEALRATFNDTNKIAQAISKFGATNKTTKFITDALIPFKNTPLNIINRGVEYSPLGFVKGFYQLAHGEASANEVIDSFASGLTGTGIVLLGALLRSLGMLRIHDDDKDRKKYFDQENGEQDYALVFKNGTYTIDWLDPIIMPLAMGAMIYDAVTENGLSVDALIQSSAGIADPIFETSMLSGITDTLKSYSSSSTAQAGNMVKNMVQSYALQFIPTILGQVARSVDDTRRKTSPNDGFFDQLFKKAVNKIPFASRLNEPYINKQGQAQKNEGNNFAKRLFLNMVSPGYYSSNKADEYDEELYRLYEKTSSLSVFPSNTSKSVDYKGESFKFNDKEYTQYHENRYSKEDELVNGFIDSSIYQDLSDEKRAKIIEKLRKYSGMYAKDEFLSAKGIEMEDDEYAKYKEAVESDINLYDYFVIKDYYNDLKGDDKKLDFMNYLDEEGFDEHTKQFMYGAKYGKTKVYGYVEDLNYDDETKNKIYDAMVRIEPDYNEKGKAVSNSKAKKLKEEYIKLGVYDDIVKYCQENLEGKYTSFGLTKSVVEGSTKKKTKSTTSKGTSSKSAKVASTTTSKVATTNTTTKETTKTTDGQSLGSYLKAYSNVMGKKETSSGGGSRVCGKCGNSVVPVNGHCPVCGAFM